MLSDGGGGLHTLLSLRQQAASGTATKATRLLSFVHRRPTRRGDRARRARPEDFAGDVRPGGGGGGSRRRAGGLNAIASGSDSAAAAASASFLTCQGIEGIGAGRRRIRDRRQAEAPIPPGSMRRRGLPGVRREPPRAVTMEAACRPGSGRRLRERGRGSSCAPGGAAGRRGRGRGRRRRSSRPGDGAAGFDRELIAGPDRPVPGSALEDNPLARNGLPSFDQVLIAAPQTGPRRDGP